MARGGEILILEMSEEELRVPQDDHAGQRLAEDKLLESVWVMMSLLRKN